MNHSIAIIDYGSQYTQLIARRVRELQVYCEIFAWDARAEQLQQFNPAGFILSGGPSSVYDPGAPVLQSYLLESKLPILGICYGMQLLAFSLGGIVESSATREYGQAYIDSSIQNPLIPFGTHQVWMSHGDRVQSLPKGFAVIASSPDCPIAAMMDKTRQYYGLQFHPEVRHTPRGQEIIANFVLKVCGVSPTWTPENIIQQAVTTIRTQVGSERVLSAVSGGVDSTVATALVHRAIGNKLDAIFVDTGMMRLDEPKQVVATLRDLMKMNIHPVDASDEFYSALSGITDPEKKRKIIGALFIDQFEQQAQLLGNPPFLVQGTIYPDVVESSATTQGKAEKIKSHHNVGGLPEKMRFKLVEPLRNLFKDEVRKIGEALGIPEAMVWRQPFPGPGLAVRCLGEVTPERLERLRLADHIFISELTAAGLLNRKAGNSGTLISQAFAALLPVKAVGVMGDKRTYAEVVALRAVTTEDFMTADWAVIPPELLARVSTRIVNEVRGVNRVVYDITSKPPATVEWE